MERPVSVTVLAVFHFILGGIGLLCGLCGLASQAAGPGAFTPAGANVDQNKVAELTREAEQKAAAIPFWDVYRVGNQVLYWGLSVALIVAGIGLLQMKPWGRYLSLAYAGFGLLHSGIDAYYLINYINPLLWQDLAGRLGADPRMTETLRNVYNAMAYATPVVEAVYPLVVLIVMLLPSVAAAFRGERPAGPAPEAAEEPDRWGDEA